MFGRMGRITQTNLESASGIPHRDVSIFSCPVAIMSHQDSAEDRPAGNFIDTTPAPSPISMGPIVDHQMGRSSPAPTSSPKMPYLQQNWRPRWIDLDAVRSPTGTGHVQLHRPRDKPADVVSHPSWDAPIEDWGHYFWSSPETARSTKGIRWLKNNKGIKLRQVRGFILVASRAPSNHQNDQNNQVWHRACAELLAFPRRYEEYVSRGLNISTEKVTKAVEASMSNTYTDKLAARELALQGVTVNEVNDAQPYGFFLLLDNRSHPIMGKEIWALIDEINKVPKNIVEAVPRFEPQVYLEPSGVLISTKASSSRKSPTPEISDDEDDYRY